MHILPSLARGGGERLVIELAERQAAAGHDVTIIAGHQLPSSLAHHLPDVSVGVHWITERTSSKLQNYFAGAVWVWRERGWLATRDVIHCHLTYGAIITSIAQRLIGRFRRPAFVETYHAVGMPIPKWHRWLHSRMAASRDALGLMVDNPYWLEFARDHPDVITEVIPAGVGVPQIHSVSAESRQAFRARFDIPPDAPVVGTISRLVPARRTHLFASIFAQIALDLGEDVHFFIGGDGPDRDAVEAAVAAVGMLPRVHFAGTVEDEELAYSIMDFYVTSNVGPVCGVAGLQAIAAGLPTVALQLRADYCDRAGDWIWSSADPEAVGREAARLMRSPKETEIFAAQQRAHVEAHHSAQAMTDRYERLYCRVARL